MTNGSGKAARGRAVAEKRGGYASSSKPVSKLGPPPRGPAPGASANAGGATKSA